MVIEALLHTLSTMGSAILIVDAFLLFLYSLQAVSVSIKRDPLYSRRSKRSQVKVFKKTYHEITPEIIQDVTKPFLLLVAVVLAMVNIPHKMKVNWYLWHHPESAYRLKRRVTSRRNKSLTRKKEGHHAN